MVTVAGINASQAAQDRGGRAVSSSRRTSPDPPRRGPCSPESGSRTVRRCRPPRRESCSGRCAYLPACHRRDRGPRWGHPRADAADSGLVPPAPRDRVAYSAGSSDPWDGTPSSRRWHCTHALIVVRKEGAALTIAQSDNAHCPIESTAWYAAKSTTAVRRRRRALLPEFALKCPASSIDDRK